MSRSSKSRPAVSIEALRDTAKTTLRVIIASYFLAAATSQVLNPTDPTVLSTMLPDSFAAMLTTLLLFATGLCFLFGVALRPVILMMGAFLLANALTFRDAIDASLWRDVAFLAALLLLAHPRSAPAAPRAPATDNLFADVWDTPEAAA